MIEFFAPTGYKTGLALYKAGQYAEAIEQLNNAVRAAPRHAKSHFKLGMSYFKLKQWDSAHAAIKTATDLEPDVAEWRVQLAHSAKLLSKTPIAAASVGAKAAPVKKAAAKSVPAKPVPKPSAALAKAPAKAPVVPDAAVQALQQLLIKFDLDGLDKIASLGETWTSMAPGKNANRARFLLYLNAQRYIVERNLAGLAEVIAELENAGFSQPVIYFKAVAAYLVADYPTCIELAQMYLFSSKTRAGALHLLVSAAALVGDTDVAWQAASSAIRGTPNALAWRYLAALVRTPADGMRLLTLWQDCLNMGITVGYDRFRSNALIDGLVRADKFLLAKNIAIESLKTVHAAKNPGVYAKQRLRIGVEDHHPEWLGPFEYLDSSVMADVARFRFAMKRTVAILDQAAVQAFCTRHTLLAIEREQLELAFPGDVELGVFGVRALGEASSALAASGEYLISVARDRSAVRMKHLSGVTVTIRQHDVVGDAVHHFDGGVVFSNADFGLTQVDFDGAALWVPDNIDKYLSEYFFDWREVGASFSLLAQAKNVADIAQPELLKIRLYQTVVDALVAGNAPLVEACYRRLHGLGEQVAIEKLYTLPVGAPLQNLLEMKTLRPQVVLYLSGLENVGYQGNMWLPVLQRLDVRCAIVVREKGIAKQLQATDIPVFFMETMRDLELLESSGVRTILYPANTQKNVHTLRFFNLNHFFINHGESDKVVNQSKFLMAYDKLLVAGPMAEQRLRNARLPLRPEQIEHVGRPQVELMLDRIETPRSELRTILYAPTWEGFVEEANYSSVNEYGMAMLSTLSRMPNVKVLFKPHPYTGYDKAGKNGAFLIEMTRFANANGIEMVDSAAPIFDYMNMSDLMITDISSVLNDYLYTWKPMILTNPRGQATDLLHNEYPSTPATYVLNEPTSVARLLERIEQDDALFPTRVEICRQSLGDIPEGSMVKFSRIVSESVATEAGAQA